MSTIRYFSKTLLHYFLALLGLFSLGILLFVTGFYFLFQSNLNSKQAPSHFYQELTTTGHITVTDTVKGQLSEAHIWLMVLDQDGTIASSYRLPSKLNRTYSRSDIAKFSRWYLADYPVYTYAVQDQLLVLGYPKDSDVKIAGSFKADAVVKLAYLGLGIIVILLLTYFLFFWRSRLALRKEIEPVTQALTRLPQEDLPYLDESGNLSEIKSALNQASQILQQTRDMQSHWIRGITHDLRSPLTLIAGYTDQLEQLYGSSKQTQQINLAVHQMTDIMTNLNLLYLLDSHEIKQELQPLDLVRLLRQVIVDFLNHHPTTQLEVDFPNQALPITGSASLLTRAITNCLNNCLQHNPVPHIMIQLKELDREYHILICDDGTITPEKVLELNQKFHNYSQHGMGTIITKQILLLHGGSCTFHYQNPGLTVRFILPALNND
ncbi:Probable sensor histidine kinase TcrY [Chlamydia trachomatis]|nr:Probable sensor histidine kinase TcrY [Chlamydia trachomatis]